MFELKRLKEEAIRKEQEAIQKEKERQIEIQRLKEVAVSKFVVSISIPSSSFKPVSLSLPRSPLV